MSNLRSHLTSSKSVTRSGATLYLPEPKLPPQPVPLSTLSRQTLPPLQDRLARWVKRFFTSRNEGRCCPPISNSTFLSNRAFTLWENFENPETRFYENFTQHSSSHASATWRLLVSSFKTSIERGSCFGGWGLVLSETEGLEQSISVSRRKYI